MAESDYHFREQSTSVVLLLGTFQEVAYALRQPPVARRLGHCRSAGGPRGGQLGGEIRSPGGIVRL